MRVESDPSVAACPRNTDRLTASKAGLVLLPFSAFLAPSPSTFIHCITSQDLLLLWARECFIKPAAVAVGGPKPFLIWVGVTSQFAGQWHTSEMESFGLLQADIINCFTKKSLLWKFPSDTG